MTYEEVLDRLKELSVQVMQDEIFTSGYDNDEYIKHKLYIRVPFKNNRYGAVVPCIVLVYVKKDTNTAEVDLLVNALARSGVNFMKE